MHPKYRNVAPQAGYMCTCGFEHYSSTELFYYEDSSDVAEGEGFYCIDCIDNAEDDRFREEIDPLRKEMVADMISNGIKDMAAEEIAAEAYPFDRAGTDICLAVVLGDKV